MEPRCVSSAGGKHLKQGAPPTLGCDGHPCSEGEVLPGRLCWRWGCGRVLEPGGHAPREDGSAPPGRQVGGDAAAVGLAQALVSSRMERGWILVGRSSAAPLSQALDGATLHPPPPSQASHLRDPLPSHSVLFLMVFLSNWSRHPCARHTSFTSSPGAPTGRTRLLEKRSSGAGRD